jgi:hypothetical protein
MCNHIDLVGLIAIRSMSVQTTSAIDQAAMIPYPNHAIELVDIVVRSIVRTHIAIDGVGIHMVGIGTRQRSRCKVKVLGKAPAKVWIANSVVVLQIHQ